MMIANAEGGQAQTVKVRSMIETDHVDADRIFRMAFGTFLGLPDPMAFAGDADYIRTRWAAAPEAALTAEIDGQVVGSNFATRWGSVGFFGPLTVDPPVWDRGVARRLMDNTMEIMDSWGLTHTGLFTFSHSPKHLGLYQLYGFQPRFLTAVLSAAVGSNRNSVGWSNYSADPDQGGRLADCAVLTNSIYPGLDVSREIRACHEQRLGDTVLLDDGSGFAICHVGPGTEAGTGTCFIKFAAARTGSPDSFARLLDACETFATAQGAGRVVAGMSTGRRHAYRMLGERGYRADLVGVAMHRPDEPGYHRADTLVVDDWR
jgi:GNAT superfamily N-acetyltransferase